MRCRAFHLVFALTSTVASYRLAPRVVQTLEERATYQGAWALYLAGACPQNYSTPCGDKTTVNQVCCPTGNTCFGGVSYCCPTAQDCTAYVKNFPTCVDPAANMFAFGSGYFCCAQGQTGVYPTLGYPFCQGDGVAVPVSIQATMISQFGGTSVTPFGGFGTEAPGSAGTSAGSPATTTSSTSKSATSPPGSTSTSTTSTSSGFQFSTPIYVGIGIGLVIVLAIIYGIYRCCVRRIAAKATYRSVSYKAGPSVLSGYANHEGYVPAPSSQPPYYPPPYQPNHQTAYDPVVERGTIQRGSPVQAATVVSPLSSPPAVGSPLPEYGFKDEPEGRAGPGATSSIELLALDDAARGRAEMSVGEVGSGRVARRELPVTSPLRERTELPVVDTANGRVELG